MPELLKVSELSNPSDDEYQYALDMMEEVQKLCTDKAFMESLRGFGKKKAKVYSSIVELREAANEMFLNPGEWAAQEEDFLLKQKKRMEKKLAKAMP